MYKHKRLSTLRVRYFKELDIFNNLFSIAKLLKNTIEVEKVMIKRIKSLIGI